MWNGWKSNEEDKVNIDTLDIYIGSEKLEEGKMFCGNEYISHFEGNEMNTIRRIQESDSLLETNYQICRKDISTIFIIIP